jgi:hypothetical protein
MFKSVSRTVAKHTIGEGEPKRNHPVVFLRKLHSFLHTFTDSAY